MEKEKSCCCGEKHEETHEHSCCCGEENKVKEEKSCCHHSESEEKACCHAHSEEKEECCCGEKHEETHEHSCCCGEESKVKEEKSCCHHSEPEEKACCHAHNEDKEECSCGEKHEKAHEHSCCSSHNEGSHLNCCGIEKKSHASCCGTEKHSSGNAKRDNIINIVKLVVSLAFLIAGYFNWHHISANAPWTIAFYYVNPAWVALIICGIPILVGAVKSLARKKITASVLISVAMISAVILEIVGFFYQIESDGHSHSYVFVAAEVAFLMAIGGAIEDFTVKKSRAGIERLVGLIPKEAFVKVGNNLEKRPLEAINIGDIVVIKAGEQISVDGEIINGKAYVSDDV